MPSFIFHLYDKYSNVETYKELKRIFTNDTPEVWQKISINSYYTFSDDVAINFEQGDFILVLEKECLQKLSTKQIYLVFYCWSYFHNISIMDTLFNIRTAIEKEYVNYSVYGIFSNERAKIIHKKSLELFDLLLEKLPPETTLEYTLTYR